MFENPRRGRQARNFTTNVPKILDLNRLPNKYFPKIVVVLYEVCIIKKRLIVLFLLRCGVLKKINKRLVCTHPDLLERICKFVDRKKFGLIYFPRLIYCDQEPLLLLNLTVHLFGCTYKAISTRYKICFTPKSLNFSMGASFLAVTKYIYLMI